MEIEKVIVFLHNREWKRSAGNFMFSTGIYTFKLSKEDSGSRAALLVYNDAGEFVLQFRKEKEVDTLWDTLITEEKNKLDKERKEKVISFENYIDCCNRQYLEDVVERALEAKRKYNE